jgi:hypothetical protein
MKNISIKPTLWNIIDKNDQILDLLSEDMWSHEVISDIILWESENLISPNIEWWQIFDKKMKNIASKLLPYWDFSNIHFIISHSREVNAYYFPWNDTLWEHIAITLWMIEFCKNEDELVSVIAHELWHWYKHHKIWEWNNTRWEEIFSEIWLMGRMYDAWWNPEAVYHLINRLHKNKLDRQIQEIFDVHGLSRSMLTVSKNALVYTKQSKWAMPECKVFTDKNQFLMYWKCNSFELIKGSLKALSPQNKCVYLWEYCSILFWLWLHKIHRDVSLWLDTYIYNQYAAGDFSYEMIWLIFKNIPINNDELFPLVNKMYCLRVEKSSSPEELIDEITLIPEWLRYSNTLLIVVYNALKQFNWYQFLKNKSLNDSFYEKFCSLYVNHNNIMAVFQLRKMFLIEINETIFSWWNAIWAIISYSKKRSKCIENVFAFEEIIFLLKKWYNEWLITLDEITTFAWLITKNQNEDIAIADLMSQLNPVVVTVSEEPQKEKILRKINSDDKENTLKEACNKIYEISCLDWKHKDIQLKKLLSYYNLLIEIDQDNIDFITNNLLSCLDKSLNPFFNKLTRQAIMRFIDKYNNIFTEKNRDALYHALGFYSIVLDFYFWYLTFHHLLFENEIYSDWEGERSDNKNDDIFKNNELIDNFYNHYVAFFNKNQFTDSTSMWYKLKMILAVSKNQLQISAQEFAHLLVAIPYRLDPIDGTNLDAYKWSTMLFWLKRESFKKKIQNVLLKDQNIFLSIDTLIDFYLFLLKYEILSKNNELEEVILNKILLFLEKENTQRQYSNIMKILLHHVIEIPHIRIKIYTVLVNAVKNLVESNNKSLNEIFDEISKCSLIDKYTIIDHICSTLITQEKESKYAKNAIYGWLINSQSIQTLDQTIFREQSYVMLMGQTENKNLVIDYILSSWSSHELDMVIVEFLYKDPLWLINQIDIAKDFNVIDIESNSHTREITQMIIKIKETKDMNLYNKLLKMHREVAVAHEIYWNVAKVYHQNYRSSPFWIRALLLDHLVSHITVWFYQDDYRTYELQSQKKIEQYMYSKIIDSLLPQESNYSNSCKKLFEVYYSLLQSYEKTLFLSAIIAWSEKITSLNADEQIGTILAHVLWAMWPAETKFWQALNSYPNTPNEISKWLYRLKSHAQIPSLWEIREMLKDPWVVPKEISDTIISISNVYGWSIHITIVWLNQDWNEIVITIQRKNALSRIQEWFRMISGVVHKIWEEKQLNHLSHHASVILNEAKHITENELDSNIMNQQYIVAQNLYNGCIVKYNDTEVVFEVPTLFAYGTWYKYISYLPWAHFNDIVQSTFITTDIKKIYAKIILFKELLLDFQWKQTDKDRHWDNIRIDFDKSVIWHFDFGWLSLIEPTQLQKKLLWLIGVALYKSHSTKKSDPLTTFLKIIDDFIIMYSSEKKFFATLQQRLLSLWDYFKIISEDDIQEVMMWILSQDIDPIIKKTIEDEIWINLSLFWWISNFSISNNQITHWKTPKRIDPVLRENKYDPLDELI